MVEIAFSPGDGVCRQLDFWAMGKIISVPIDRSSARDCAHLCSLLYARDRSIPLFFACLLLCFCLCDLQAFGLLIKFSSVSEVLRNFANSMRATSATSWLFFYIPLETFWHRNFSMAKHTSLRSRLFQGAPHVLRCVRYRGKRYRRKICRYFTLLVIISCCFWA